MKKDDTPIKVILHVSMLSEKEKWERVYQVFDILWEEAMRLERKKARRREKRLRSTEPYVEHKSEC